MPVDLEIMLSPERLDEGTLEERAGFGLFTIRTAGAFLTEGIDFYLNGYRAGPLLSGYHVAEWLAWNWWRLRWEPRSQVSDWAEAHCLPSIGEGYVWPNITIFSDGVRSALISQPSASTAKPFRYFGSLPVVVPASLWESAVDAYIPQILGRLRDASIVETNLDRLWADILAERTDPAISERRRLEAMLSRDPDSVEDDTIERLLAAADRLGRSVLGEVAANSVCGGAQGRAPLTATDFEELARSRGRDASPRDTVRLAPGTVFPRRANVPAWRLGVAAARALRTQEHFGVGPISDARLAEMAGTQPEALTDLNAGGAQLSFFLDARPTEARLVLRSKWHTGRRFDVARLIGDRLSGEQEALHPATRTYTYRQKSQRAFAAELLSPFEAVDGMLAGDYDDEERRQEVAEHFDVSPKTIETLLMNHGRLERAAPVEDFDIAAVAA
jgi:hypothetical protein